MKKKKPIIDSGNYDKALESCDVANVYSWGEFIWEVNCK